MGHEYVEMKNSHAAIEAYRRAVGNEQFRTAPASSSHSQRRCQPQRLQGMVWIRPSLRAVEYAPLLALLLPTRDGLKVRSCLFLTIIRYLLLDTKTLRHPVMAGTRFMLRGDRTVHPAPRACTRL